MKNCCWLLLAALAAPTAVAQDTDGDGLPDSVETQLGSDPGTADKFTVIWERPARPDAKPPADPGRSTRRVAVANAGGNRFLWRVEFLADYPQDSLLQLYLDADHDPATGRQPNHGCEFMLRLLQGEPGVTAFAADGANRSAPPPRVAVAGDNVYFSYDVDLPQRDGASVFRLSVLSETGPPVRGVHGTGYFAAQGPPRGSRPKIVLDADRTESVGLEQTWGLDRLNALVEDPRNVTLGIRDCVLDGFRLDKSEYRADNARRTSAGGTIAARVPPGVAGRFFVGFIFYDSAGREVVGVRVRGEQRGVAVADFNDNNQHLHFLTAAVELEAGDEIQLCALGAEGAYRTEDLLLLREKPAARPPLYEFREVAATDNRLTWITTWATAGTVEYELPEGPARKLTEALAVQNHRVTLPELRPQQRVRYRLTARTREGREMATAWREHTWEPPVEPPTTRTGTVPLRVEPPEAVAAAGSDWPVTSGVPFPKGALGSAGQVRLRDAQGTERPLQAAVTGRWPDHSVKWLLLDFRHRGPAADYTLEFGPEVRRREPDAPADPPPDLGELVLTDGAGREHTTRIAGLEAEEQGGLRRCWHGAGALGNSTFSWAARAHVHPGLPCVRVLLTFGADAATNEFTTVRRLAWRLPAMRGEAGYARQLTDSQFEASGGAGKRFAGAVGPVFVRDFWQNYPKALEVGPAGATLWLMPGLKPDEFAPAKGTVDEHRLYFWFDSQGTGGEAGGYRLRQGMTKTHEVWLGLDGRSPPHDRPLLAVASPRWYADSSAFGELTVADAARPVVGDYDRKVADTLRGYLQNRERNREYGLFNFGDWWGERVINWGNVEYDTPHAFFLQFVRSGDQRFFQAGEEAETHHRDVDTVHHHRQASRVGGVYLHCIGHVGDYYDRSPLPGRNQGIARGGFSVSHTWCEGHMDHYFLTGDRRSLETGLQIADHYNVYRFNHYDFSNCRDAGWHLILTLGVHRATGDPFYLNAARIIVERVLERQTLQPKFNTAGGGWRRMMVPGHCLCEPAHYGNAGFMVGVLLTGLKWYHLETRDPRVAESLIRASHFLIDDMWAEEAGGFRYTSCPKSSAGAWSNFLLFDGMAYAYRLTQQAGQPDPKLARHLWRGTAPAIQAMSGMGKSFSQFIRVTPHFMGVLAELEEQTGESRSQGR